MSDYRRFIAYLYEYPNNRKGGCCGFVRVESQNGFCRMDFQIKSPSLPPETSVTASVCVPPVIRKKKELRVCLQAMIMN